mgnify:CR=1 FL=1
MGEPFISVKNLSYAYDEDDGKKVQVLKNLSIDIMRGEFLAVLGHNGSGKSTLAKLSAWVFNLLKNYNYVRN